MRQYITQAFTIVELIVVVTILAILATVGFVAYSGYLSGSRDANRYTQIVSLTNGLNLHASQSSLPLPEESINIIANSETVARQGLAGKSVLDTIGYSKGGTDPKTGEYFSYYLNKSKNHFQLMTFLEDTDSISFAPYDSAYANAYIDLFPTVYGNNLGIMTDQNNNPVHLAGVNIDISTTTDTYKSYFDEGEVLEGDSSILAQFEDVLAVGGRGYSLLKGNLTYSDPTKSIPREGLIMEYLFEDDTLDNSGNENHPNENGTIAYTGGIIMHQGSVGKALVLNGTNTYLSLAANSGTNEHQGGFTWSFWMKGSGDQLNSYARVVDFEDTTIGMSVNDGDYVRGWINASGRSTILAAPSAMDFTIWRHILMQRDGINVYLYVDNALINSDSKGGDLNAIASGQPFTISQGGNEFYGVIDNFRAYNRSVSSTERLTLFQERDIK